MQPRQIGRRKQVCKLRSAAEDVNSLARLEPMDKVGELDLRKQGLLTDTALLLIQNIYTLSTECVFVD